MPFPTPEPGLLIRYAFLWREAAARGQGEGDKDRPCAVVLTVVDGEGEGETVVVVLPITHSPPADASLAVEVPASTKRRLGLDDDRSWIVVTDANRFHWPGPDLRPRVAGDMASVAYGMLPAAIILEVREKLSRAIRARQAATVSRSR